MSNVPKLPFIVGIESDSSDSDDSFDIVDAKEYGILSESGSSSESSSSGDDEARLGLDKFEETVAQAKAKVDLAKTTPPPETSSGEASAAESDSSDSSASSDDAETSLRGDVANDRPGRLEYLRLAFASSGNSSCSEVNSGKKTTEIVPKCGNTVSSDDDEGVERKALSSESETSSDSEDDYEKETNSGAKVTLSTIRARSPSDYESSDYDDEELDVMTPPPELDTLDTSCNSDDDYEEDSTCSTESEDDGIQELRDDLKWTKDELQYIRNMLHREREQHKLTKAKLQQATSEAEESKRELQSATEKFHAFDANIRPRFEALGAKLAIHRTIKSEETAQLMSHNSDLQKMVKNFQGALRVKDETEKAQDEKIDRLTEEVRLLRNALASETNLKKLYKEKALKLIDQGNRVIQAHTDRDQAVKDILTKVSVGETYTPSHVFCV